MASGRINPQKSAAFPGYTLKTHNVHVDCRYRPKHLRHVEEYHSAVLRVLVASKVQILRNVEKCGEIGGHMPFCSFFWAVIARKTLGWSGGCCHNWLYELNSMWFLWKQKGFLWAHEKATYSIASCFVIGSTLIRVLLRPFIFMLWKNIEALPWLEKQTKKPTKTDWGFGTCLFFHILGMSSSQLTNSVIFQRGRSTTNISYDCHGHCLDQAQESGVQKVHRIFRY